MKYLLLLFIICISCDAVTEGRKVSVTLDDITNMYGCLNKKNTFNNGRNKFIFRNGQKETLLEWSSDHLNIVSNDGQLIDVFSCAGNFTDTTKKEKLDW